MAQPECTAQPRRLFRTETVCRDGEAAAAVILFLSSGERAANYRTLPRRTRFTMASRTTAPRNDAIRAERLKSPRLIVPPLNTSPRSEEHTSELQSLMRISYAVFCLKKKKKTENDRNI